MGAAWVHWVSPTGLGGVVPVTATIDPVPHVLIAADASWVLDEVRAALGGADTTFTVCRSGKDVVAAASSDTPDLAVLDLQIGAMGGMAVCMALRLEESAGRLPYVPVLMLLDRAADLHLARRSGAEGWLVKPLDALRIGRAAATILDGGVVQEGLPASPPAAPATPAGDDEPAGTPAATG